MIESILYAVAVGAVLLQACPAVDDGIHDLLSAAAMAFDTGVFGAGKGHDMNNAGGSRVWAEMTIRA